MSPSCGKIMTSQQCHVVKYDYIILQENVLTLILILYWKSFILNAKDSINRKFRYSKTEY